MEIQHPGTNGHSGYSSKSFFCKKKNGPAVRLELYGSAAPCNYFSVCVCVYSIFRPLIVAPSYAEVSNTVYACKLVSLLVSHSSGTHKNVVVVTGLVPRLLLYSIAPF